MKHKKKSPTRRRNPSGATQSLSPDKSFQNAVDLFQHGDKNAAAAACRRILDRKPTSAAAWNLLGVIAQQTGDTQQALELYQKAIALSPNNPDFHYNFGSCLIAAGQLHEAIAHFREAIRLRPDFVLAIDFFGYALQLTGKCTEAIVAHRRALELDPQNARARINLSSAYHKTRQNDLAIQYGQEALELQPDLPEAHFILANVMLTQMRVSDAIKLFRAALALNPAFASAHNNLGTALRETGDIDESIAHFEKALDNDPTHVAASSNLLLALHYRHGDDAEKLFTAHRVWAERVSAPPSPLAVPYPNPPDPGRRLRIGYVSPDFRTHSVSFFIEPIIRSHDRDGFEIFCYSVANPPDKKTEEFQRLADGWREINGIPELDIVEMIRRDQIDILVDLSGHTDSNRILIFTHKPTPIQVTYLGYPNTTGLLTMDYRLTDNWADPEGQTDRFHTEKLIRLPGGFLCYQPDADAPPVNQTPALETGAVTFGSFNTLPKITPEAIAAWAAILNSVPASRLIIKTGAFADENTRQRMLDAFASHGIPNSRIELLARTAARIDHLALYGRIDIGLDTFPYNGTTTTCEALWMGVPVVVLAGKTHVGRVGVSLLTNIGLTECIADTKENYIATAVRLANDLRHLQELRSTMRDRLLASHLTRAEDFTRTLEQAYRALWHKWCENQSRTTQRLIPPTEEATEQPAATTGNNHMTDEASGNDAKAQDGSDMPAENLDRKEAEPGLWISYLAGFPYARPLLLQWESYLREHAGDTAWRLHQMALDNYATAHSEKMPEETRLIYLSKAYHLLLKLIDIAGNISTLQSFARVATELGEYDNALQALDYVAGLLESNESLNLDEPFILANPQSEIIDPGADIGGWVVRSILGQIDYLKTMTAGPAETPGPPRRW